MVRGARGKHPWRKVWIGCGFCALVAHAFRRGHDAQARLDQLQGETGIEPLFTGDVVEELGQLSGHARLFPLIEDLAAAALEIARVDPLLYLFQEGRGATKIAVVRTAPTTTFAVRLQHVASALLAASRFLVGLAEVFHGSSFSAPMAAWRWRKGRTSHRSAWGLHGGWPGPSRGLILANPPL